MQDQKDFEQVLRPSLLPQLAEKLFYFVQMLSTISQARVFPCLHSSSSHLGCSLTLKCGWVGKLDLSINIPLNHAYLTAQRFIRGDPFFNIFASME